MLHSMMWGGGKALRGSKIQIQLGLSIKPVLKIITTENKGFISLNHKNKYHVGGGIV